MKFDHFISAVQVEKDGMTFCHEGPDFLDKVNKVQSVIPPIEPDFIGINSDGIFAFNEVLMKYVIACYKFTKMYSRCKQGCGEKWHEVEMIQAESPEKAKQLMDFLSDQTNAEVLH